MIRKPVLALLALAPAAALAQAGALDAAREPVDPASAQASAAPAPERPGDGLEVATPEAQAAAPAERQVAPDAPGEQYTVQRGDTLWDLSGRFLQSPWYWPKIWSYNPQIENPHWIYPGNVLSVFAAGDQAPGRVEPMEVAVRELEDFSRADPSQGASADEQDMVAVAGPYKIGYVAAGQRYALHESFVTADELQASGKIEAAFEEKMMLSTLDRAYARFERPAAVKVGETYVVYRTERPVRHPATSELLGYQTTVLGAARVVAVDDRAATLVISASNDPIERGALLGPWAGKPFRQVPARANARDLDGVIIASPIAVLTQFAEHQVVFVDRGSADGVQAGNALKVVRSGDLYGRDNRRAPWDPDLPSEDVGDLLVIDAREHASAALVTRSRVELLVGDRFEMRAAASQVAK